MRKPIAVILSAMALWMLAGCAGKQGLIQKMSACTQEDVFQECSTTTPIPHGYADLRIVSSLKTHLPGNYSGKDIHGTPEHKLLVNIDGQAVFLTGSLREERKDLHSSCDPEEGHGICYLFQTELRLKSGGHSIFISLPFDGIAVERKFDLIAGSRNTLVLEPLYGLAGDKPRIGFFTKTS
ncbi:hypothetical protein FDZ73_05270, partial [bacterium]